MTTTAEDLARQVREAVAALRAASHGDSNDAEIEAGHEVADLALQLAEQVAGPAEPNPPAGDGKPTVRIERIKVRWRTTAVNEYETVIDVPEDLQGDVEAIDDWITDGNCTGLIDGEARTDGELSSFIRETEFWQDVLPWEGNTTGLAAHLSRGDT